MQIVDDKDSKRPSSNLNWVLGNDLANCKTAGTWTAFTFFPYHDVLTESNALIFLLTVAAILHLDTISFFIDPNYDPTFCASTDSELPFSRSKDCASWAIQRIRLYHSRDCHGTFINGDCPQPIYTLPFSSRLDSIPQFSPHSDIPRPGPSHSKRSSASSLVISITLAFTFLPAPVGAAACHSSEQRAVRMISSAQYLPSE